MGQPFLKSAVAVLEKSGRPLAAGEIYLYVKSISYKF